MGFQKRKFELSNPPHVAAHTKLQRHTHSFTQKEKEITMYKNTSDALEDLKEALITTSAKKL